MTGWPGRIDVCEGREQQTQQDGGSLGAAGILPAAAVCNQTGLLEMTEMKGWDEAQHCL